MRGSMTMKAMKKQFAFLLALCLLAATALPLGARAADTAKASGFSDISDKDVAVDVEVLRMMGVLDGYGDGTFRPGNTLTRAQFCKMAVLALNKGGQVAQYKNYTIFPDVKSSHWAAGYINLAVRGTAQSGGSGGEDGEKISASRGIISGFADGTFGPDRTVTFGQAVTILMRMLGYQDTDVGAVWPDGYLVAAASTGLTDGVNLTASAAVNRGQAATLFANLMACDVKGGTTPYASSMAAASGGSVVSDVILLSSSAATPSGTANGLQTSDGKTYQPAVKAGNGLLNGRKGMVVLDKSQHVLTFVPSASSVTRTMTVSLAKSDYFTDSKGQKYEVQAKTAAYFQGEKQTYSDIYSFLAGQPVTVCFTTGGEIEYVFTGSSIASADAIVVADKGSTAGFDKLAGGNANYTIYKNGLLASSGDLRKYDVAVYNAADNSIQVSDTRLTGVLESVSPNLEAPVTVTVMGHPFEVLPSAAGNFKDFKIGSSVSLLLTVDNRVAGAVEPSSVTRSNAIGMVTSIDSSSVKVSLLSGLTLEGKHGLGAKYGDYAGQLVKVASGSKGMLSLSILSGGTSATLNVAERKVGSSPIAENVRVYEKVGASALTSISLSQLTQETVRGDKITYVGYDWAKRVNLLVFNDVTGDCYQYGRVSVTQGQSVEGNKDDPLSGGYTNGTITLYFGNDSKDQKTFTSNYGLTNGGYYGIAPSADGEKIAAYIELKAYKNVSNSAWTSGDFININGITYPVSDSVVCYNRKTGSFTTLGAARAWGGTVNVYYDKTPDQGGKIRVVEVS